MLIATSARGETERQARRREAVAEQNEDAFKGLSTVAIRSSLHPDNESRTDLINRIQAMGRRLGGAVFRRQSLLVRRDERTELWRIKKPALVITGDGDRLRSRAEALELYHVTCH